MAAKSNFFLSEKSKGSVSKNITMDLLPPSAFESRSKDPWAELAKVSKQISELKLENERLRDRKEERQEDGKKIPHIPENWVRSEPYIHHQATKHDTKYIDELLAKQVSEINELKSQINTLKYHHTEEVAELEKGLTVKERECMRRITSLEMDLKLKEEQYDSQIDRLSSEHQKEADELSQKIIELKEKLHQVQSKSAVQMQGLTEELAETKQVLSTRASQLEQELRLKESQTENQSKQILQLKNYIGETDSASKPADLWRKEKETLENKLKLSDMDRESLKSSVHLLNIRLSSMNEILSLQEAEMSKPQVDIIDKSKQGNLLLTRWREKVFALMVQQKSSEITNNRTQQNWSGKVQDIENQLISASNHIDMLSHSLSDKQAQIEMQQNQNRILDEDLSQAQQLAVCLDDRVLENREHAEFLKQFAVGVQERFQDTLRHFHECSTTLKSYGHRISFASGRVEMLQGLFARQEALSQMRQEETTEKESPIEREEIIPLNEELDRVTRERDSLASKMKEDAQMWNDRLFATKCQYEDEVNSLKQTVEDLELALQEKSQTCNALGDKLEYTEKELEECNEQFEECKTELGKQQVALERCVEEQRLSVQSEFVDQLAEMEKKLHDARREQTKAVVSLRQLERQTARDKEHAKDHLTAVEEDYKNQIHSLQEQVRSIESERNLMAATLRQEGLIGRVRSERREPLQLDDEVTTTIAEPVKAQTEPIDEPLKAVLEDLKSLTDAVMKDPDSSSGED